MRRPARSAGAPAIAEDGAGARVLDDKLWEDMERRAFLRSFRAEAVGRAGLVRSRVSRSSRASPQASCLARLVSSFYLLHNWFLCRFRSKCSRSSTRPLIGPHMRGLFCRPARPKGRRRHRVTGAGPMHGMHSSHAFVPVMVGQERCTGRLLRPRGILSS